jgi:hypothetical protein
MFVRGPYEGDLEVDFPHWCPVLAVAAMAAFPWIRWSKQFSLRTLLIGMALVAMGLGAIAYAVR